MESPFTEESWLDPGMWQQKFASIQWDQEAIFQWIKIHKINLAMMVMFLFVGIKQWMNKLEAAKKAGAERAFLPAPDFPDIQGLEKFSWKDEQPLKLRLFKPTYHLTMALQNLDPSELILMDKNYADRILYRKKIIKDSGHIAIGAADDKRVGPAVRELYNFIMGTYLPKRYPDMFQLHFATFESGNQVMLENLVTKAMYPAKTTPKSSPEMLLSTLGQTLDEDFLLLLPEEDSKDPKYRLQAYDVVCPSGWDPRQKLGQRLADIHGPVPGYVSKLESSMDKYFKNLEVGKYVKRANWSIVTNGELFSPDAETNHAREGDVIEELSDIDPEETFLRCERQTLHRLPKSGAVVFAFKTYLDSLKEIKDEGLGEDLAEAIDGVKTGTVPKMYLYKRAASWGEAAKKYLRS